MPVEVWPIVTVGGKDYYQVESLTRLEVDPAGNVYYLVGVPTGGVGAVGPLVKGDPGPPTQFQEAGDLTVLAYNDPTPASLGVTIVTPGTDTDPQVVKLTGALHEGPPGDPGDTVIDLGDFDGTPLYKKFIQVNSDVDGFEYATQKVGDRFIPATISDTPSGNPTYTLCAVSIPAQQFDWRPQVSGWCVITGTGPDVAVDLIARLNGETGGNEVGRAAGSAGLGPETLTLVAAPPAGSVDIYDRVSAGATATIHLRAERQTGADTFTTTNSRTRFQVRVEPIL